ncbi:MAG: disulfide bond formation protein B [Legionella sp.]|nr:MAG: disulfide bond formation protein B [Legionella sp.]PJD97727.1 MAG: disulfide bond formation protein B [Legionella sp.]
MTKLHYKKIQYLLVVLTALALFFSLYSQYVLGLEPCPLCITQRICVFILLGFMSLSLGTLKKAHVISLLQVFIATAGLFFALRQLWLQSLPPGTAPACMPGLNILMHYFPWQDVAHALLWGSGDCAEVSGQWLGLSLPAWSALYFFVMILGSIYLFVRTQTVD